MDQMDDVSFVCPKLFDKKGKDPKKLFCPRNFFRLPGMIEKEDIDSSWIWLHPKKKPELLLFLKKNQKVLWEDSNGNYKTTPSGYWSKYENKENSQTYLNVASCVRCKW